MSNKIDELNKLNEQFYKLFGRLYENRKLLTNAKALEFFGAKLFEQYKAEYELLKVKFETDELPELHRAYTKHGILVPRKRFVFFRNRSQKLIEGEVFNELEKYFIEREAQLKKQTEALKRLEEALDQDV